MPRLPGLDPEVLADLRRREESDGDRTRTRRAANPFADAATVEHVEHWPCRAGCNAMVGVTQEAVTALAISNATLVTSGERPIAKQHVVLCDDCRRRDEDLAAMERAARQRPRQAELGLGESNPAAKGRP